MTVRTEEFNAKWDDIVTGWLLITDFHDVTDRIERLAALMKHCGLKLDDLGELQRATVKMMIERQIAIGIAEGHLDGIWRRFWNEDRA